MMKNIIKYFMCCSLLAGLISCEEVIELPLADESGKIVIEGYVTDEPGPYYVAVSKSVKLSQSADPLVKNAKVVLKDNNGQTETLIYKDGIYQTQNFTTKYGDIYTLSVTVDGQEYTAVSQMPKKVKLDDVKYKTSQGEYFQYHYLQPIFTDPIEKGNLYLFKISKGSKRYFYETALLSDEIGNGEVNSRYLLNKYNILKGDSMNVEMQSVNESVFNYFKALPGVTLNGEYNGGGVPPANPTSNISNGALGYFSAHTSETKTIVIN